MKHLAQRIDIVSVESLELGDAWLGAAAMAGAVWTRDPAQQRRRIAMPRGAGR